MGSVGVRAGWATIAVALAAPALALAAHPVGGTFTSTQADVHVAKGGGRIANAIINCELRGGVTIESIQFQQPIKVKRSGTYTYRGSAFYDKAPSHRSRLTTASISGKFTSSKQIRGKVKGGPGACRSVSFSATYNPQAH